MTQALSKKRGDTIPFRLSGVTDRFGDAVADLSGYTITFTVKASIDDADVDAVLQKTSGGGGIDVQTAEAFWEITADESELLTPALRYQWDVQLEDADGVIATVEEGTLVVSKDVTRANA